MIGGSVELLAVRSQPAGVVHGVKLGHCGEFTCTQLRIHVAQGVGGFDHAMRWGNVFGQRCGAGRGGVVRVRRCCRRSGLGDGSSYRREG